MSDPFFAEIRIFGGGFAPVGWAACDGQAISISQNQALFSLLGTRFGGDGISTFCLPNFAGNVPVGAGGGAGLTTRQIGECGGEPTVTLLQSTMASHNHPLNSRPQPATSGTAGSNVSLATLTEGSLAYQDDSASSLTQLFPLTLDMVGGNEAHNNMQPYLALFFIICLEGIYPDLP